MGFLDERRRRVGDRTVADPTSADIGFFDEGENAFAQSVDAGHRIDHRAQRIFVLCVVLAGVYTLGCVIPKDLFNWGLLSSTYYTAEGGGMTLSRFAEELSTNAAGIIAALTGDASGASTVITMVRYVVVAFAGAGLALSGAVYQGAFRNALVSPSTLGVMTGGTFGMTLWVLMVASAGGSVSLALSATGEDGQATVADYLASSYGLAGMSFLGCFLVVALVLLTMHFAGAQRLSGIMMIITGQVIGGLVGVFGTMVRYYYTTTNPYGEVAQLLQDLQVASFYRPFTWIDIVSLGIPLAITFLVVMRLRQKMMLLAFDKAEQRTLGVDTRRIQVAVVGLCTLLTAIIISFCGTVGFVGFLVPHLARRLVGPNFKYLLPASTVLGAVFVLTAYVLIETTLGVDYAQMSGMFISIGGAVVFLVTALRGKGAAYGAFK